MRLPFHYFVNQVVVHVEGSHVDLGAIALRGGFCLRWRGQHYSQYFAIELLRTTLDLLRGIRGNCALLAFKLAPVARRLAPVFCRKSCIAFFLGVFCACISLWLSPVPLSSVAFDCLSLKPVIFLLSCVDMLGRGEPSSFDESREATWKDVRNFILTRNCTKECNRIDEIARHESKHIGWGITQYRKQKRFARTTAEGDNPGHDLGDESMRLQCFILCPYPD